MRREPSRHGYFHFHNTFLLRDKNEPLPMTGSGLYYIVPSDDSDVKPGASPLHFSVSFP